MAYTIVKSDGTVLTTVPDGTINTTSTSIGLPGRNYAGYGQTLDTNFVHQLENFADSTPPANPLRGQLWYDINTSIIKVCPTDGESNALAWLSLTSTSSGGTTTFGAVTVTGNVQANNLAATNNITSNAASLNYLTVSANANIANANLSGTTTAASLVTTLITTGANTTPGSIVGTWTTNGGLNGNAVILTNGNLFIGNSSGANTFGVRTDKYMYANGDPISFAGTYSNANVASYMPVYNGAILTTTTQATTLTTGANTTAGTMTGNWTLSAGSRLNATYADLAERFAADEVYSPGTVVELGGEKEITAVQYELSEDVFGVISDTAGYLMNAGAGTDATHPPVAMSGRVKVNVVGAVNKHDRLVSAGKGIARSAKPGEATAFNTIGRALESKTTTELGTVEAIVIIK
jgi:hypothetical protein